MRLCVVGLGRLGLPWALLADAAGHEVVGLDVDAERVSAINHRRVETGEPGVRELLSDPRSELVATTDPAVALANAELSVVTVSTPSEADGSFGLAGVLAAVETIGAHCYGLAARHVVVLKSTVSPGSTDGAVRAALVRASGGRTGTPELVHAPEFHAIGSIVRDITQPYSVIVGGSAGWAVERAAALHRSLAQVDVEVALLDTAGAELAKLASNSFRTMKIAFANSLAELCVKHESNPVAVCAAIGADPHIGRGYLSPGLPYGGPCYPRDNPAMSAAAAAAGIAAPLSDAIETANELRFRELENALLAAAPGGIGIIGVSFKEGTDELEGSPALELARRWRDAGREVVVHDPLASVPGDSEANSLGALLDSCAAVLLATPAKNVVDALIAELAERESPPPILDPWGALSRPRPAADVRRRRAWRDAAG